MAGLSTWIASILAVAIIGVLADLLLSGNRMHKFVRGIFGVVTLFVIAAPLPNLIKTGFKWNFDWGGSVNIDQGFLDSIHKKQIKILEDGTEQLIARNGIEGAIVTIQGTVDKLEVKISSITINLMDVVYTGNNQHIDIVELVSDIVSKGLDIDKSIIIFVGGKSSYG